ncbi:MAG: hypothetical protein WCO26_01250 [Deltaproteobacteria bacterium]
MTSKDDEVLIQAIQKIQGDLDKLMVEVNKKKNVINEIYGILGQPAPYEIEGDTGTKPLRPDQFYGKAFATAATEFLQRKRHACTAEEIYDGLKEGGFKFPWEESDRLRSVAISLAKNSTLFHKLPNNTFGLLAWYPDIDAEPKRRRTAKNEQVNSDVQEMAEMKNTEDLLKEK